MSHYEQSDCNLYLLAVSIYTENQQTVAHYIEH